MTSLSLLRSVDIDGSLYDPLEDVPYGGLNSYIESAYDEYISGETYGYITEGIGEAIKKFFKTIIDTIKSIASKIWNGIKSLFGKAKDKAGELSKGSEKKRTSTFKESDTKYDFIYFEGLTWNVPDIMETMQKELDFKLDKKLSDIKDGAAADKLKDEKAEKKNNDIYNKVKEKETPFEKFGFKKQSSDYEKLKDLPSGKIFSDKRVHGYAHESLRLVTFNGTRKEASEKASAALNSLENTCGAKKFSTELTKVAKELEAKYLKGPKNEAAGDSEESGSQNQGENNDQNKNKDSWGAKEYKQRTENAKVNDDDSGAAKGLKIIVQHIQKIGLAIFKLTYGAVRQTYDTLHGNSLDGKANEENRKYRKEERDKKQQNGENTVSNNNSGGKSGGSGSGTSTQQRTGTGEGNNENNEEEVKHYTVEQISKMKGVPVYAALRPYKNEHRRQFIKRVGGPRQAFNASCKKFAEQNKITIGDMQKYFNAQIKAEADAADALPESVSLSQLRYMADNYYEFLL